MKAINIVIKFGVAVVKLPDQDSRITTREGVEIWIQKRPANEIRAMANIPNGTLEKYKHYCPEILKCEWV